MDKNNWKERILGATHELAADLFFEHFKSGRIRGLIESGELSVDELATEFKKNIIKCLEIDKECAELDEIEEG